MLQKTYRGWTFPVAKKRTGGKAVIITTIPMAHGRSVNRAEKADITVKTGALLKPVFIRTLTVKYVIKNLRKSNKYAAFRGLLWYTYGMENQLFTEEKLNTLPKETIIMLGKFQ